MFKKIKQVNETIKETTNNVKDILNSSEEKIDEVCKEIKIACACICFGALIMISASTLKDISICKAMNRICKK